MARFMKGDVVVVPFPFSDLTQAKRRPALVISALEGDDLILCQITTPYTLGTFMQSVLGIIKYQMRTFAVGRMVGRQ